MKNQRWSGIGEKCIFYILQGVWRLLYHIFSNAGLYHHKKQKCAQPRKFNFSKQWCKYIQCENFAMQFFRRLYWWDMFWWVLGKHLHIYLFNICSHWLLFIFCFHQTSNNSTKNCTLNPEGEIFRKPVSEGTSTHSATASENKTGKRNGGVSGATRTETPEVPLRKDGKSLERAEGLTPGSLVASCTSLRPPVWVRDIPSFAWLIVRGADEQRVRTLKSTACQYALSFKRIAEEIFSNSVT